MASNRIGRINEEIQRELASQLRRLKDPRVSQVGMVSVTRVDTTGDLRYAKVFISVLDKSQEKDVLKGLKSASGFLRRELGHALQLRYTPELQFIADDSIAYGAHILEVLRDPEKVKPVNPDNDAVLPEEDYGMLTVSETAALLRSFDHILILTHVRPDGDTVGCAAGLCAALRALGKTAYLLPNPGLTDTTAPYFAPYAAPADFVPEKVVSTDIAAVGLFPENAKPYIGKVDLAIDHHPSFEGFGKANIVRPEAAACGELILDIVQELTPVTPEIALPLYVAISTDTGGFIYSNVTADTHRAAAALMDTGIDYRPVNKLFFQTKSRVRMQLEAAMLADARFYDHNRAAVLSVPRSLLEKFHATESDAEDLSALGPQIQGVDCAVTMRELGDGVWKFSLRTGERVNATEVCRLLGGGGHARAAGATLEHVTQAEAEEKMLDAIARVVPDFKK